MAYMPTEEELRHEIGQQKRFFLEQHSEVKSAAPATPLTEEEYNKE